MGDFGLARAIGQDPQAHIKQSHTARIVGTSGYIAPEYYRGVITTKLDTYAFGVVGLFIIIYYFMFTSLSLSYSYYLSF